MTRARIPTIDPTIAGTLVEEDEDVPLSVGCGPNEMLVLLLGGRGLKEVFVGTAVCVGRWVDDTGSEVTGGTVVVTTDVVVTGAGVVVVTIGVVVVVGGSVVAGLEDVGGGRSVVRSEVGGASLDVGCEGSPLRS